LSSGAVVNRTYFEANGREIGAFDGISSNIFLPVTFLRVGNLASFRHFWGDANTKASASPLRSGQAEGGLYKEARVSGPRQVLLPEANHSAKTILFG
jgi:hypothetical protein